MPYRNAFAAMAMALAAASALVPAHAEGAKGKAAAAPVADAAGNLRVPENYRQTYEYLGTWSVSGAPKDGAKEMHVVYASPGTTAAYRKTGKFPEGAVLVKEVFDADTKPMTTGIVSHEQVLKGWFVMVKDAKGSHPGNKLWGDGWGWSWFGADNAMKTTSTDYHTDCQGCHTPAKSTDWIYVEGYPVLK
jgi:hypothetical protein